MDINLKRNTKQALEWIVGILRKHQVPFQISGGCAAKIYGSPRELNDIDIDMPENCFEKILVDVKPFIIYGPAQYKDQKWDLYLMTLNYAGQEIDIGSGNAKISTKDRKEWISFDTDFSKAIKKEYVVLPKRTIEENYKFKKLVDESIKYALR